MSDTMLEIVTRLRAGEFASALRLAEGVLATNPQFPPALGAAAHAARMSGDRKAAEAMMRRLLVVMPEDVATRGNLATLLIEDGRTGEALGIVAPHRGSARLAALGAWLHQQAGDLPEAAAGYEAAISIRPEDPEAWTNLGNVRAAMGDRRGAAEALDRAVQLGVSHPDIFVALAGVLTTPEAQPARLRVVDEGLRRFPGHAGLELERALAQTSAADPEPALRALTEAAAREGNFGAAHLELGLFLENLNRIDALEELIERAVAQGFVDPEMNLLRAWVALRRGRIDDADHYAAAIPDTISPIRRAQVRGQIAERQNDAAQAFVQFAEMNRAVSAAEAAPPGETYRELVQREAAMIAASAALPPPPTDPTDPVDPICVVGFPRSGTTLLDTLLSALPELQVFEEQPMLHDVRAAFPDLATMSDPTRLRNARTSYHAAAERLLGPSQGRWIVDKHPLHMAQLAPLYRLFPSAPIVMVERHPCDVVLSCFMANFTLNHAMRSFTDLEEAALTYDAVFTSFAHAEECLPLRIHRVRYERMITDLEGEMRSLLAFLGIDWDPAVLDNVAASQSRGQVRTASYAQIGVPIYSHARERWRRYRDQMAPVLPILEPWVTRLGYEL